MMTSSTQRQIGIRILRQYVGHSDKINKLDGKAGKYIGSSAYNTMTTHVTQDSQQMR